MVRRRKDSGWTWLPSSSSRDVLFCLLVLLSGGLFLACIPSTNALAMPANNDVFRGQPHSATHPGHIHTGHARLYNSNNAIVDGGGGGFGTAADLHSSSLSPEVEDLHHRIGLVHDALIRHEQLGETEHVEGARQVLEELREELAEVLAHHGVLSQHDQRDDDSVDPYAVVVVAVVVVCRSRFGPNFTLLRIC